MIRPSEWRLRTALVVLLALSTAATLVTLVIVGGGLFLWQLPQLQRESMSQAQREAQQLAARMELLLGNLQHRLQQTGATVARLPGDPDEGLLDLLTAEENEAFEAAYVADPSGVVVLASVSSQSGANRAELLGTDLSANRLYRLALEHNSPVWSGKFLSALSGNVTVGAAVPAGGRVLIGELPLDHLLNTLRLATKDPRLLIWVIDSRGELVAETGFGPKLGPTNVLGLDMVQAALRGGPLPHIVTIRNSEFHPAVARSGLVDWHFLVLLPAGLNNPDIRSTAALVVAALLSSLLIGTLLAPFVAGWIARPLRAFTDRARQVAAGMPSGDWPRGRVSELNALAVDLETMAKHLQERRDQFSAIFNASPLPMAVAEAAGDSVLIDVNEAWIRQFRRNREETVGRSLPQLLWVNQSDFPDAARTALHDHGRSEVLLHDAEQRLLLCAISARHVVIGGETFAIWVIEDISARKRAEELIKANNELLEGVTRLQREFLVEADPRQAFDRILNHLLETTSSEYGFIGEILQQPDGQPYLKTHAITNIAWNDETRSFYEENAPAGLEFRNLNTLFGAAMTTCKPVVANDPAHDPRRGGLPLGHPPLRAFLGVPLLHGEELIGMVGLANRPAGYDEELVRTLSPILATCSSLVLAYTLERERKDSEEALRRSEARLAEAQRVAQLGSWELDLVKDQVVWSEEGYRLLDIGPGDAPPTQEHLMGRVRAEDKEALRESIAHAIRSNTPLEHEFRIVRSDGSVRWVHSRGRASYDATGRPIRFVGTTQDITARKEAELALSESRERLDSILGSLDDVVWSSTPDGSQVLYMNPAAERIYGRPVADFLARKNLLQETVHPEDAAALAAAREDLSRTGELALEHRIVRPDGTVRWLRERAHLVTDAAGQPLRLDGISTDITDRKRAYERIQSALAEKEVLLKEIYHRVKNNLQVVSSLLNLQSRRLTDGETKRLLDESANRVKSMALVHEQLYRTENLSSIGLREYLRQLANNLISVNRPLSMRVTLRLDVEDLYMGIESAIPFGLVVNELVSNAYQHGYPAEGDVGEIVVRVTALPDERVCLEVRDDGRGLPADFAPGKGESLGIELVMTLAKQLGGELTWDAAYRGARFALTFKPEPLPAGRLVA